LGGARGGWGKYAQWQPPRKIKYLNKSQSLIQFIFLWLNDLKFAKAINKFFSEVLLPTDAKSNCFKRILKFTLKQHVSV
jgi:hypothetical protein